MSTSAHRHLLATCALALVSAACGSATNSLPRVDGGELADGGAADSRPADVVAGEALAQARGCAGCHGSSEHGLLAGSSAGIGGKAVYAPNITPDTDTGIGQWTDLAVITALRYGVDDEGFTLCSEMPREPSLTDEQGRQLVAYLRSVPAVKNDTTPESSCTPSDKDVALHGQVVVQSMSCTGCHGADLSGRDTPLPGTSSYAPNLTPDMATGVGGWTREQLVAAVRDGVDDEGATLCSTMPRYQHLSEDDLAGVAAYLKSIPAVSHETPETVCGDPVPDAGVAANDGGVMPSDGGLAGSDAGTPGDAGAPLDGGAAEDAGVSDGGSGPVDAGTLDGGTTPVDGGTQDGGSPAVDAGVPTCGGGAGVVISEVYGAGGNSGAVYKTDYVELHNRTAQDVDLSGMALQYASATGFRWSAAPIPAGTHVPAGGFVVFTLAGGSAGVAVPGPTVALMPAPNLSATSGKVALTSTTKALTGSCPKGGAILDFMGYGSANCSEGSSAAPALSKALAGFRQALNGSGQACTDTNVNGADFATGTPAPHQGTSACSCP